MKDQSNKVIFIDSCGNPIKYIDFVNALKKVDADKCDILMLHTELSFGIPAEGIIRNEILQLLFNAIKQLNVGTLLFPSFTFSFSNKQEYDVLNSKTSMGVLNEFARKQPNSLRSVDPQMSFVAIGDERDIVKGIGKECIGKNSIFDKIHKKDNVNILFFGTKIEQCFTHQHYVEWALNVPYRYNMDFTGTIKDDKGKEYEDTYSLFVKYRDIIPYTPPEFVKSLLHKKLLKMEPIGDSALYCFKEKDAFDETKKWIEKDINSFLAEPYDSKPLVKEYRYGNVTTVQ